MWISVLVSVFAAGFAVVMWQRWRKLRRWVWGRGRLAELLRSWRLQSISD